MEEDISPLVSTGVVSCIRFSLASFDEICKYSINNCPISHPSQLGNPFLGLPLESGRCESCGTMETEKCEGHFGYIELPIPVYHPSHISELKNILSMLCLKCLRVNRGKIKCDTGKERIFVASCTYCREISSISVNEVKKTDGAVCLELRVSTRHRLREGYWNFLDKFGFLHGESPFQTLHPLEVHRILNEIPEETKKRLSAKGFFPQNGFIIQFLPVPPNCLSLPAISDGKIIMYSDNSRNLLRRVFTSIEKIKTTGTSCSENSEIGCLQAAVARYLDLRGIAKAPHGMQRKLKIADQTQNSSKMWLEKIRTLFISKGSGFSSRSVITGDPYIGVEVIGLPLEIAKRVTFEERVSVYNLERLQKMVNDRLCVAYVDGENKFSIETSAEGHVKLKIGQIVSRRIMDGDVVFLNRPPSTHKHSLQAFFVALHDENVVKINPLVCSPLGADFDGDCVHIFYPQSLAAKAEAIELFSVEKQLLSSHNALLNMQFAQDSLLSLRLMSNKFFLTKERAQQLAMFVPHVLPSPALVKAHNCGPWWTILQILQCAFPSSLDCSRDTRCISGSDIQHIDFKKDSIHASLLELLSSMLSAKGPKEGLMFFNTVQPLLMEVLNAEGFSISLQDFDVPKSILAGMHDSLQQISILLSKPRSSFKEVQDSQVEDHLKILKLPVIAFILKSSSIGTLIDSKSESSISKVLQQLGFVGLEIFERGKLYSKSLVMDIFSNYLGKHSVDPVHAPSEACGLVKSSFFCGLNPYEDFVHSISTREVIVRSSRGLTEPGTLFKNLMATLRDAVVCYDGTVRNVCNNSIIQFEYRVKDDPDSITGSLAGEPVGVLAATAISNPAYKAVLDSSLSTISSWELMKEVLLSKVSYQNTVNDRRVVLYLTDCQCGKRFCKEIAAFAVQDCLRKISDLNPTNIDEVWACQLWYKKQIIPSDGSEAASGLVGHIHLDKARLKRGNKRTEEIIHMCREVLASRQKKKGQLSFLKGIILSASECCEQPNDVNMSKIPCLQFYFCDHAAKISSEFLDRKIQIMANFVCPMLLDTVVRGDSRIESANIVWVEPTVTSVGNRYRPLKGALAIEVVVAKVSARRNGDAWRTVLDACLPIMHLIDTHRSIPYGIKQVEDLLGISSSFEQSVHRLSTSIRMVAKGVLKEHLILVANSMTCTGGLLGFNNGGFKKLLRSLKVQMPFTEATLFTPVKCLERAAEKCCTDTLTSIVSSCLWGKHVAVGTGSCFKVFWDKQQVSAIQDVEKDVYDFLELVQTTDKDVGVDELVYDSEYDYSESPHPGLCFQMEACDDRNDSMFDLENNVVMVEEGSNKSNWGKVTETATKLDTWEGWESKSEAAKVDSKLFPCKDGDWSGWENGKAHQSAEYESQTVNNMDQAEVVKGWGRSKEPAVDIDNFGGAYQRNRSSATDNTWVSGGPGSAGESNTWGNSAKDSWNTQGTITAGTRKSNYGKRASFGGNSDSNKWNESKADDHAESAWGSMNESEKSGWKTYETSKDGAWKNHKNEKAASAKTFASDKFIKNKESAHGDGAWISKDESETWRGSVKPQAVWCTDRRSDAGIRNNSNYENASVERSTESDKWNENKVVDRDEADWGSCAWGSKVENQAWISDKPNTVWNSDGTGNAGTSNSRNHEKRGLEITSESDKGNKNGALDHEDVGWGSRGWRSNAASCSSWKSPNVGYSNAEKLDEANAADNGKSGWKSRAWGSTEGRRSWKNFSKTGVKSDEYKGRNVIGTHSGKRSSAPLTTEEEQILFEVDRVFGMTRKILYDGSVGKTLSSEDQQFIKEHVLEYHPEKERKVPTDGSDYHIMVDKHGTFTESSCFFVVSSDGTRTDFSYIKCLKNFVLQKFPEHGDSFNNKYFRKPSNTSADTPSEQQ